MTVAFKPRGTPWNMSEIKVLKEKYESTDLKSLSNELGRTTKSIQGAARKFGITNNRQGDGKFNHGAFKMERVIMLMQALHTKPMKVSTMSKKIKTSTRTIHRYIGLMAAVGVTVKRVGVRYQVEFNNCPLCGHTTNNH